MKIKLVNLLLIALYYLLVLLKSCSTQFTCPSVCVCPTSKIVSCINFNDFTLLDFLTSMLVDCDVFELKPLNKVNKLIE